MSRRSRVRAPPGAFFLYKKRIAPTLAEMPWHVDFSRAGTTKVGPKKVKPYNHHEAGVVASGRRPVAVVRHGHHKESHGQLDGKAAYDVDECHDEPVARDGVPQSACARAKPFHGRRPGSGPPHLGEDVLLE
jgi:hypothetical protein